MERERERGGGAKMSQKMIYQLMLMYALHFHVDL